MRGPRCSKSPDLRDMVPDARKPCIPRRGFCLWPLSRMIVNQNGLVATVYEVGIGKME
jgi:hypothetical protein